MLLLHKQNKYLGWLLLLLLLASPAAAHKVEVSGEVGGTSHIEPNDNPRAGTPSLAWFAITRRGGELIPLADCNCQLEIYAAPYAKGATPIQEPSLKSVSQEGYQNILGADITFPQVGAYTLVLRGEPIAPNEFQPFELTFPVTVVEGQASPSPSPESASSPSPEAAESSQAAEPDQPESSVGQTWAIASGLILVAGLGWAIGQRFLGKRK